MEYPIEAEVSLSVDEIRSLRNEFNSEMPNPSPSTKFNLAWGEIRSSNTSDVERGLKLMYQLYLSEPRMSRECLYYLALGSYKIGEYSQARKYADELLKNEPNNGQARGLRIAIDEKVRTEGLIGLGIVGGGVALAAIAIAGIVRAARR